MQNSIHPFTSRHFRKKPVVIEAMQLTESNIQQVYEWVHETSVTNVSLDWFDRFCDSVIQNGFNIRTLEDGSDGRVKHVASIGDWIIKGIQGEFYPCKPDIFAKTYEPAGQSVTEPYIQLSSLTFGQALEALKAGKRIARKGWNGRGMFLWLLPAGQIPKTAIHDPALRAVIDQHVEGDTFEALPSIRMWTRNSEGRWGVLTGWTSSQTDMLSNDWEIVN